MFKENMNCNLTKKKIKIFFSSDNNYKGVFSLDYFNWFNH